MCLRVNILNCFTAFLFLLKGKL
jgi:hypothetical protein